MIRAGTITSSAATVTALKRTDDLVADLFIYGDGIPVDTKILSIDSSTQVTMRRNATKTGSKSLDFTPASVGVYHERNCALIDAENEINERGEKVIVIYRTESNVTRDRYNSIKKRQQTTKYILNAYPITIDPSKRAMEKAGLREEVDALMYTPMRYWNTQSVEFKDLIAEKITVKLRGETYELSNKGMVSQFSDTFLYITFGLNKK